jgi:hypothetical protein
MSFFSLLMCNLKCDVRCLQPQTKATPQRDINLAHEFCVRTCMAHNPIFNYETQYDESGDEYKRHVSNYNKCIAICFKKCLAAHHKLEKNQQTEAT